MPCLATGFVLIDRRQAENAPARKKRNLPPFSYGTLPHGGELLSAVFREKWRSRRILSQFGQYGELKPSSQCGMPDKEILPIPCRRIRCGFFFSNTSKVSTKKYREGLAIIVQRDFCLKFRKRDRTIAHRSSCGYGFPRSCQRLGRIFRSLFP